MAELIKTPTPAQPLTAEASLKRKPRYFSLWDDFRKQYFPKGYKEGSGNKIKNEIGDEIRSSRRRLDAQKSIKWIKI